MRRRPLLLVLVIAMTLTVTLAQAPPGESDGTAAPPPPAAPPPTPAPSQKLSFVPCRGARCAGAAVAASARKNAKPDSQKIRRIRHD